MADYQISAITRRCYATGKELEVGEKVYSVLVDEDGKFVRNDYSEAGWQGPPPGAFSFWVSKIASPNSTRKAIVDGDMLLECFQRLDGQEEPSRIRFRYVLALLLMRKKQLRLEDMHQEAGQEILRMKCVRTGADYLVVNPGLSEEEMIAVQDEVFQVLGWD